MDNKKRTELLKLGYFPVTSDFWAGAEMPRFIESDFKWAFRMPLSETQLFMPFTENKLDRLSYEELKETAALLLTTEE